MKFITAALLAIVSLSSTAGELEIRKALDGVGPKVKSVQPAPIKGLFEVVTEGGIVYTDVNGSFLIFGGNLIDIKGKKNITEERWASFNKIDFKALPLANAVKRVKGDGSRVMVTFEDANCGYCKKLTGEIEKMNNVTVYTFLVPMLSPDSGVKAKDIWCSTDPAKAWLDWSNKGQVPATTAADCKHPTDSNRELAGNMKVQGTPAIIFTDGTRIAGYATTEVLEARLTAIATKH